MLFGKQPRTPGVPVRTVKKANLAIGTSMKTSFYSEHHLEILLGGIPTPLKNDGVSSSVGMINYSQLFLESHKKKPCSSHHETVFFNMRIS